MIVDGLLEGEELRGEFIRMLPSLASLMLLLLLLLSDSTELLFQDHYWMRMMRMVRKGSAFAKCVPHTANLYLSCLEMK